MYDNCQVIYKSLPYSIRGFTLYDAADDYYTIVINSRYDCNTMKKTLDHELWHIKNKDFYSDKNIDEIELKAHNRS